MTARAPILVTLAALLALAAAAPVAVATHEPPPPPPWQSVCPQPGGCDTTGAWWEWLTHTPWPLPEPCLPTSDPACM